MLPVGLLLFAATATPDLFNAYVEPSTGHVGIERSDDQFLDGVDWLAVARREFPGLDPKHPPPEMLLRLRDYRLESDSPQIPISGPAPPMWASRHFYLLAMEGVIALRLTGVEGWISLDGEDSLGFRGRLAADSRQRNIHGGFAFGSGTPLSIRSEQVPVSQIAVKMLDSVTYQSGRRSLTAVVTRVVSSDPPISARRFQIGSEAYLLVRWKEGTIDCESVFSLFRLSRNEMREVRSTGYDCDP
jgi:hypothetical protein